MQDSELVKVWTGFPSSLFSNSILSLPLRSESSPPALITKLGLVEAQTRQKEVLLGLRWSGNPFRTHFPALPCAGGFTSLPLPMGTLYLLTLSPRRRVVRRRMCTSSRLITIREQMGWASTLGSSIKASSTRRTGHQGDGTMFAFPTRQTLPELLLSAMDKRSTTSLTMTWSMEMKISHR